MQALFYRLEIPRGSEQGLCSVVEVARQLIFPLGAEEQPEQDPGFARAEKTGHQYVKALIADGEAREWIAGRQLIDLIAMFPIALMLRPRHLCSSLPGLIRQAIPLALQLAGR